MVLIEFPPKVEASWLESAISRCAAEPSDDVTLHLEGWKEVQLFGEGRLLQWMRHLQHSKQQVVLDLAGTLPTILEDPRDRLWTLFKDQLGAMVLVDAAAKVLDGAGIDRRNEIDAVQAAVLAAQGGEVGFGRERTLLCCDELGKPPAFRVFSHPEHESRYLKSRVRQLLAALWLKPQGEQLGWLASFVRELLSNTREHARDDLAGQPVDGIRFAQFRRISIDRQPGMERLVTDESPARGHLERLSSNPELGNAEYAHFVEVTVADSGVGIPARYRGTTDIYTGSALAEKEATIEATAPDKTSKLDGVMGSGQGLHTALEMAQRLHGLVVVRTGRWELVRDTTVAEPGEDGWRGIERPHLPGTAISMLLPWWQGAQTRIPASAQ